MTALTSILTALSFLTLGAHFLREGRLALVLASLALIALLFVRRPWARRALQCGLAIAAIEWVRVLAARVAERQALGESWERLALILGVVAAIAALSVALLETPRLRRRFGA